MIHEKTLTIGKDVDIASPYIAKIGKLVEGLVNVDMKSISEFWADKSGFQTGELIYAMAEKIKKIADLVLELFPVGLITPVELPKKVKISFWSYGNVSKDPNHNLQKLLDSIQVKFETLKVTIDNMDIELGDNVHYQELGEGIYNLYLEIAQLKEDIVKRIRNKIEFIDTYKTKNFFESTKVTLTIGQIKRLIQEAIDREQAKVASEQLKNIAKMANAAKRQIDIVISNPRKKETKEIATNALKSVSAIRTTVDKVRISTRNAFGVKMPKKAQVEPDDEIIDFSDEPQVNEVNQDQEQPEKFYSGVTQIFEQQP